MNILYHHRTQATGAAGHHIREMVKAFRGLGYNVDIVSPPGVSDAAKDDVGSQKKNRYRFPQIFFEMLEMSYNLVALINLRSALAKKRYKFIYERYAIFNIAGIIAANTNGTPVIIEVSFTSKTSVFPKRTRIFAPLARVIDRFIFSRADGIVVVSSVLKKGLIEDFGVPEGKILVLPNAVDPEIFNPGRSYTTPAPKYSFSGDRIVGFVGGFYPWHGLDFLMDTAESVIKEMPHTKFVLVGDGPMKETLTRRVKNSVLKDAVIFTGSVPHNELPKHIASFDIGVMPDSNAYGSPIKIFEYMAMGKPVLAPKLGPIEEVVEDGVNGLTFARLSKEKFSEAIVKILTDEKLYQKIAANSRKDVLEKYNWSKNAEAILKRWESSIMRDTKKEIRFLLQYFYPEVASTAQLMTELAEGLAAKGYKIKALVGQPTYVKSRTLSKREVHNGIEIERLSCARFEKNSSIGRMLNWMSYTALAFFRLLFSRDKTPLFIVSTPPFLFVVGYLLNILKGQKYVCLIYDLYPDIAVKLGYAKKDSFIVKMWDRLNRRFFKRAEYVVVPSENMKTLIADKIGDSDKIKVIYNWADGDFLRPMKKEENWFSRKHDLVDKLTILYAGNMGLFHQLETLVEAADKLREDGSIKFVFIGEGGKKQKLMDMAKEKGLKNVLFLPYQDKGVLPYSLTCSDISVVSLEKGLDCVAAPCKLYTSMAAGQIILGLVDSGSDVAKIVNRYDCGFCADQDDVNRVVEILAGLSKNAKRLRDLKASARRCFEENFQKAKEIDRYDEVFTNVIKQKGR